MGINLSFPPAQQPDKEDDEQLRVREQELRTRMQALEEKLQRRSLDVLAANIHPTNEKNGFWGDPEMMDKYAAKIALIHSEVTEVLEALRKSQGSHKVTEEFSDIFIRALDLYYVLVQAGEADPELYGILLDKLEVNANRPPKHGNRWG